MNRPNKKDYCLSNGNYSFNYTEELEKYCDQLEEESKRLNKELLFIADFQTKDYDRVQKELWQYQKALNKACKFIKEYYCSCPLDTLNCNLNCEEVCDERTSNFSLCWKEWALKDD